VPNPARHEPNPHAPTRDQSRLVLVLTKELVDRDQLELLVEWLNSLSSSPQSVFRYRNSLSISIAGFDERTPALNPRCRAFFQRLARRWPYWLHFIEKEPESLGLLLMLLAEDRAAEGSRAPSREAFCATMAALLSDADRLYAAWGVPEAIAQANCDAATAAYFAFVEPIAPPLSLDS